MGESRVSAGLAVACQQRHFEYSGFMQSALESNFVSLEDYLAGEERADTKHEFIGGVVYAMAGTTTEHNQV